MACVAVLNARDVRRTAGVRLDAALDGPAVTFRGMTARPDESNCECHWGSAEELARLKVPDVELDPDLLVRTWEALSGPVADQRLAEAADAWEYDLLADKLPWAAWGSQDEAEAAAFDELAAWLARRGLA